MAEPGDLIVPTAPAAGLDWLRIWTAQIKRARAWTQYQYVNVTFNATANADTDIPYSLLKPPSYEEIDWIVVGISFPSAPAVVPVIYRDSGANRRPWGAGFIVLRSNVGGLTATLLLTVRALPN